MNFLNKSLITNLLALLLILIGFALDGSLGAIIKTMGLYAFSGAVTNWLAVHMLFEKVPLLYGSGIITNRFEEFKAGIKSLITNQFFTKENIERFLSVSDENKKSTSFDTSLVIESIDFDRVFVKLKAAIMESQFGSMLSMFGGEAALDPLRPQFEIKFKEIIDDMLSSPKLLNVIGKSSLNPDTIFNKVSTIIDSRLEELTPKMVKEIIAQMIREHLGWLVVWGGVFGALIGLISTFL